MTGTGGRTMPKPKRINLALLMGIEAMFYPHLTDRFRRQESTEEERWEQFKKEWEMKHAKAK